MKQLKGVIFCTLLFFLTSCVHPKLSEEKEYFSKEGVEYSFNLPAGWKGQEDYQEQYNEAAVFGAEDTTSNAYMFIRVRDRAGLKENTLEKEAKKLVKESFGVDPTSLENIKLDDQAALRFSFKYVFKQNPVWVSAYYILQKQHLVEYIFYTPQDNQENKRTVFDQSVETLTVESITEQTTTSEQASEKIHKIENDSYVFDLTGYKIISENNQQNLLIVRYVFKNKSDIKVSANLWETLVTVEQDGTIVNKSPIAEHTQAEDLSYLLDNGKQLIGKNDSIESAVVYQLNDQSLSDITFSFDKEQFKGKTEIIMPIKK
ncbi:hypothetical protein ATZ33_11035 [Enterococcus silesiacus]|uniref:DUF5067 domain-containing protein n=1 Tax=Enterococcus silesiacus TaxID=332949 RepID=A0A0S3KC48_9ENTE|nr:DUF5067 domain-containing protein [Enterococcus silesiacus]ALS01894.1 hypothetical protein ATZ33_11035 [Enterococcus silesiacus]OJG92156.1 hypothetical protein RV15_GL003541 [Enterococcus silesiacus]